MKHLLIGSTRANSGKSATILGLGLHLQALGLQIGYGKPLGTFTTLELPDSTHEVDADVEFITQTLHLLPEHRRPTQLAWGAKILKSGFRVKIKLTTLPN
jgi:uncharacterized protein